MSRTTKFMTKKNFLDNPPDQIGMMVGCIIFGLWSFYYNAAYYISGTFDPNNYVILVPIYTAWWTMVGGLCGMIVGNTYPLWIVVLLITGPLYVIKHYVC